MHSNVPAVRHQADGIVLAVAPFPPLVPTTAAPTITANATAITFFSSALQTPISSTDDFMPYPSVTPAPVGSLNLRNRIRI